MSQVEFIGKGLYGDSWQSQLARDLKNPNGKSLVRQTIQGWHSRGNLPDWAKKQMHDIAIRRHQEITAVLEKLNENP